MTDAANPMTDEMLTAYLDGMLEPAEEKAVEAALADDAQLAQRLAMLDLPLGDLRAIMAPSVLGAPTMPDGLIARLQDTQTPRPSLLRKAWMPTAIAASFVAGLIVTTIVPTAPQPAKWVDAVASYQALYVTETLDQPAQDAALTVDVLARAADRFDVALAPALEVEGLSFKRAQMLGWNGKPLLQIAYLTQDGTPMALCLTRVGAEDRGPTSSVSHNLAGVSWVQNGVGYYLIGGEDVPLVEALSQQVIARL